MTPVASLRVGWCPGALRPMRVGDGLLVRVKPRGNRLTISQALAVADLSSRLGNGVLDVTSRANLQIRGLGEGDLPATLDALARQDLVDRSAEAEAVRNVVASPLSGADPAALLDIGPIVAALDDRLLRDEGLWRLPAKFAWSVDDGGTFDVSGVPVDVTFVAVVRDGRSVFAVTLAGGDAHAVCEPARVAETAAHLAAAFLALSAAAGLAPHRMRDLVELTGAAAILARAGLRPVAADLPARPACSSIGVLRRGGRSAIGVAAPFGRLEATSLQRLTRAAARWGTECIRLTPWRSLLVADLTEAAADEIAAVAAAAGLVVNPADPRLAVAACAGLPGCLRATTPVHQDAARLAALLPGCKAPLAIHVSGCAKGCAHAQAAPLTLVGHDGLYDIVHDGTASDAPTWRNLPIAAVAALLAEGCLDATSTLEAAT